MQVWREALIRIYYLNGIDSSQQRVLRDFKLTMPSPDLRSGRIPFVRNHTDYIIILYVFSSDDSELGCTMRVCLLNPASFPEGKMDVSS